jgi:hypothetical protein
MPLAKIRGCAPWTGSTEPAVLEARGANVVAAARKGLIPLDDLAAERALEHPGER